MHRSHLVKFVDSPHIQVVHSVQLLPLRYGHVPQNLLYAINIQIRHNTGFRERSAGQVGVVFSKIGRRKRGTEAGTINTFTQFHSRSECGDVRLRTRFPPACARIARYPNSTNDINDTHFDNLLCMVNGLQRNVDTDGAQHVNKQTENCAVLCLEYVSCNGDRIATL